MPLSTNVKVDQAIASARSKFEMDLLKKYPRSLVGILNYFKATRSRYTMIQQSQDAREAHIAKQEIIRKCLAILIDNKLMEFTVYKYSVARHSSNNLLHKDLDNNPVVIEALRNSASELAWVANIPESDKELLLDLALHFSKLANLLYTDSRNFDKQPFSLESELNSRLKEDAVNFVKDQKEEIAMKASKSAAKVEKKGMSDLIILMKWFNNRYPSNATSA